VIIVLERDNAESAKEIIRSVNDAIVYLPRPMPAEIIAEIDPHVREYRMPKSTWQRLSRKAKQIIGNRYRIESRRGRFAKMPVEVAITIISLYRSGVSIRKIAEDYGIPKSTVHYIIKHGVKMEDGDIKIIMDQ